jgi:hypothetical protein
LAHNRHRAILLTVIEQKRSTWLIWKKRNGSRLREPPSGRWLTATPATIDDPDVVEPPRETADTDTKFKPQLRSDEAEADAFAQTIDKPRFEPSSEREDAMKSRFMDGVSWDALMSREITDNDVGRHEALSGLSDEFRKSAKWHGPEVPPSSEGKVLRMLRLPHDEPNPTENVSFAFVDRTNHKGDPEISVDAVNRLLEDILDHVRPMSPHFYKAGAVVFDSLSVPVIGEWAAETLGLREPNEAIARAFQSALLGAFISSVGPIDLEAITIGIGTFIHSLPGFAKLLDGGKWHLPYGDRTAYQLLRES